MASKFTFNPLISTTARHTRLSRDKNENLQEMFSESSLQVEDTMKRLAVSDNKVTELLGKINELSTKCEMLSASAVNEAGEAGTLIQACQSDKVAASRAMQQNIQLKQKLEEMEAEGKLVSEAKSKAEILDQLDNLKIRLAGFSVIQELRNQRLHGETDTIGNYVIMYQQQRARHENRIREKEQQVAQLASDRAELQEKLSQLLNLV